MLEHGDKVLDFLDFTLFMEPTRRSLWHNGRCVDKLSVAEVKLLWLLASAPGSLHTDADLRKFAWDGQQLSDSSLFKACEHIRAALRRSEYVGDDDDPTRIPVDAILTRRTGAGYVFYPPFPATDFCEEWNRHGPFCGRTAMLRVQSALSGSVLDRGYVLLVGSPGVGKSALLYECHRRFRREGVFVISHFIRSGVCDWDQPLAILRNLLAQLGVGEVHFDRSGAGGGEPDLDKLRRRFTQELETRKPVVILDGLDEIHPTATEGVLKTILPAALPSGVHFVCGTRPGTHLSWLNSLPQMSTIDLDNLDNQSTCREFWERQRSAAKSNVFARLSNQFIDAAVEVSGGNMLITILIAQEVKSRQEEIDLGQLPHGVVAWISAMWTDLARDTSAREGLRVLCAARDSLTLAEIAEVLGDAFDPAQFLDQAEQMLMRIDDGESTRYRVFHDVVREVVIKTTAVHQWTAVHAAFVESLARWTPGIVPSSYATRHALYHLTHAGDPQALHTLAFDPAYLRARVKIDSLGVLAAELQAAADCTLQPTSAGELGALSRIFSRQSQWIKRDPGALESILQFGLRCAGSSDRASLSSPLGGPKLILQHPIQHSDEASRSISLPGITTWDCQISEDERTVVCTAYRQVAIWDLSSGDVRFVADHPGMAIGCALSADGRLVASGGLDCTVQIWSLDSLPVTRWRENGTVGHLAFIESEFVVTPCWDGTIGIWHARSGEERRRVHHAHRQPVLRCVASRDGSRILSSSSDGTLGWWEISTGRCIARMSGHEGSVPGCDLTARADYAVSGGRDDTLCVWDTANGAVIKRQRAGQSGVNHCIFLDDGKRIVSAGNDGSIKLWEVDLTRNSLRLEHYGQLPGYPLGAYSLAASHRSSVVVTGGYGGVVKTWQVPRSRTNEDAERHATSVTHCAFLPGEQRVITASADLTIRTWDVATGTSCRVLRGHTGPIRAWSLDDSGDGLATGAEDGTIRIWDLATNAPREVLDGRVGWITGIAHIPGADAVLFGASEGSLHRWPLGAAAPSPLRGASERGISCMTTRGDLLLIGFETGEIELWSLSHATLRMTLHADSVVRCSISRDQRFAVSIGDDEFIRCWDLERGECRMILGNHEGVITDCCFWADDRRILSCSADCSIRLWNPEEQRNERSWYGYNPFLSVAAGKEHVVAGDMAGNVWFFAIPKPAAARSVHS